jgi:hypothetical protein
LGLRFSDSRKKGFYCFCQNQQHFFSKELQEKCASTTSCCDNGIQDDIYAN